MPLTVNPLNVACTKNVYLGDTKNEIVWYLLQSNLHTFKLYFYTVLCDRKTPD